MKIFDALEQHIDASVLMEPFFGIEAFGHKVEHKRGVHPMLVGGFQ